MTPGIAGNVHRLYVEKKEPYAVESGALAREIRLFLGITGLRSLRIWNRYDVEGITAEVFERCIPTIFAEPPVDGIHRSLPADVDLLFAVEYLPGQFDQRADSCAQCIQVVAGGERPLVQTARVYLMDGTFSPEEREAIRRHLINPVESREAVLGEKTTLHADWEPPAPVEVLHGFTAMEEDELAPCLSSLGLSMDLEDLSFCRSHFADLRRDPTVTELRVIDTYWSDHCRHTTFLTEIDHAKIGGEDLWNAFQRYLKIRVSLGRDDKPVTLMDLATAGARWLAHNGELPALDVSEEVNACTVKIDVDVDGRIEPWLLLFKNETHNHPTEIEPFGGAATCIGGAIRDPLSGRAYVYQAMRVTGAADPLAPIAATLPGKLPQRKIVTAAAAGYSSYGNQVGLATGLVDEIYHPGYVAKRMEVGAVIAAAPADQVRRLAPEPGDLVLLVGGRTGRDGCGGATGSSRSHDADSLGKSGAEVQKGNAPEERKIQRLFRNPEAARRIKRCNDFGAGGVSVAVGELADGLAIDLDAVPKKYEGLDGTELAISESQERMAVVIAPDDLDDFLRNAAEENLEATVIARVTEEKRMVMRWNGRTIVDLDRAFLASNGTPKHTEVETPPPAERLTSPWQNAPAAGLAERLTWMAGSLRACSRRGLAERFDSTIGAGTVLFPFGGLRQETPMDAMVARLPVEKGSTRTCSVMAYGFDPYFSEECPFLGSYLAVVSSVARAVAAGGDRRRCWLSLQEYFEKPRRDPKRWGKPFAALLGALDAQLDLGIAAIGGKDSMSGSFEDLDVPPTLLSFAAAVADTEAVASPEWKRPGSSLWLLEPKRRSNGLPEADSFLACCDTVHRLLREGKALSVSAPGSFGVLEHLFRNSLGNRIGVVLDDAFPAERLYDIGQGSFLVEMDSAATEIPVGGIRLGTTIEGFRLESGSESADLDAIVPVYEGVLEPVFPTKTDAPAADAPILSYDPPAGRRPAPLVGGTRFAAPRVLIPVFPGTNCEYDTARAAEAAGAAAEILVVRNLSPSQVAASVEAMAEGIRRSQMVVLPGGFSGGDEPDGSGKFITAFFRSPAVTDAVRDLLFRRDGLMLGICNGFQALVKLGLVPYGDIVDPLPEAPTLTFNTIGRHQSRLVRTRIASTFSPWLSACAAGDVYTIPISHGEGRFVATEEILRAMAERGQIATQYADTKGNPSMEIRDNPNGSVWAVEGITSPDGRVFGKMGHMERYRDGLLQNVPGRMDLPIFQGAAVYFR